MGEATRSTTRGNLSRPTTKPLDLGSDASDGGGHVAHHELRIEAEHPIPRAFESAFATCISCPPSRMIEPINLDHETHLGSQQVHDEPSEHRYSPAKGDSELPSAERLEEACLGLGGSVPHRGSALFEHRLPASE